MTIRNFENVETRDSPLYTVTPPTRVSVATRERPVSLTRDRILEAVPIEKVCALGRVWAGDLKPLLDAHVEAVRPIVSGFTLGQTLTPEPTVPPGQELSVGRRWGATRDYVKQTADAMRSEIRKRAARDDDDSDDRVDLAPVMDAINELERQADAGHPNSVGAAIGQVQSVIGSIQSAARSTADSRRVPFVDNGGKPLPQGGLTANIRAFREGRTNDGRTRGPMQRAIDAARAARKRMDWPPDAA